MKKSRKIMMVLCVVALLVSVLAIPASAATNDHYHTFSWEGSQRYASVTTVWRKANNSPTYFRVENDSMPLDGFYPLRWNSSGNFVVFPHHHLWWQDDKA